MKDMPLALFTVGSGQGWRLTFDEPRFIRLYVGPGTDRTWFLIGPDWTLPENKVITVRSFRLKENRSVLVGKHIMEHVVNHQGDRSGTSTRYVIATIYRQTINPEGGQDGQGKSDPEPGDGR